MKMQIRSSSDICTKFAVFPHPQTNKQKNRLNSGLDMQKIQIIDMHLECEARLEIYHTNSSSIFN